MRYRCASKSSSKESKKLYEDSLRFSKFLYFLCAPTLVYRTEYPKIPKFRVRYMIQKIAQTVFNLVVLYLYIRS